MAGIYIHIPFCRQACTYCNFHFSVSLKNKQAMIAAIIREIGLTEAFHKTETIETVYIGGGTPSLLYGDELEGIFDALGKKFTLSGNAEITLEANPDDITKEMLSEWHELGVNRLSVGIQSFNEDELKWMNRAHTSAQSFACLDMIREAGFEDFSVDLIYGSPLQTNDDLERNFSIIAEKNIPHISCYAFTEEPGTAFAKSVKEKRSAPTDPQKQSEQFHLLLTMMDAAGYEQYEISNFCRPGHRSRHNSSYWQGKAYYGFGPAAHSFDGDKKRKWNISNNSLYIQSLEKGIIPFEEEALTDKQKLNEYIMTSLRTAEGLDLDLVKNEFSENDALRIDNDAAQFLKDGRMNKEEASLILTNEGKFFADGIASDLFV